jgi:hypothetical protein
VHTTFLAITLLVAAVDKRPTTYTVDPRLTTGPVENFRELFVDPVSLASQVSPATAADGGGRADLVIKNEMTAWGEVTVGSVKVGVIGPLTDGRIRDVPKGTYDVLVTYSNGFVSRRSIATVEPAVPADPAPAPAAQP